MKIRAEGNALIAFESDIRQRTFPDWLRAHTSFMKPLHRYEGSIILHEERLSFSGIDKKGEKADTTFELDIYKNEIFQLYHGHDNVFSLFETRSLGLTWKPLRISYRKNEDIDLYLIINYRFGTSSNSTWFQILKDWLTPE